MNGTVGSAKKPRTGQRCLLSVLSLAIAIGIAAVTFAGDRLPVVQNLMARLDGYILRIHAPERHFAATAGDKVTVEFPVTNVTSSEVKIVGVETGCGCVSAEPVPMTVPAGETLVMTFTFDTQGREQGSTFQMNPRFLIDRPSPPVTVDVRIDL